MSLYLFLPTAAQRVQVEEFKQAFQQAGKIPSTEAAA